MSLGNCFLCRSAPAWLQCVFLGHPWIQPPQPYFKEILRTRFSCGRVSHLCLPGISAALGRPYGRPHGPCYSSFINPFQRVRGGSNCPPDRRPLIGLNRNCASALGPIAYQPEGAGPEEDAPGDKGQFCGLLSLGALLKVLSLPAYYSTKYGYLSMVGSLVRPRGISRANAFRNPRFLIFSYTGNQSWFPDPLHCSIPWAKAIARPSACTERAKRVEAGARKAISNRHGPL